MATPDGSLTPGQQYAFSGTQPLPTIPYSNPLSTDLPNILEGLKAINVRGVKYNKGKPRIHLLPPEVIFAIVEILEFGATKYGEFNWQKGIPMSEIYDATLRHLLAWQMGETNDPESGKPHVYHAACNLAFMIYFHQHRPDLDDRQALKNKESK